MTIVPQPGWDELLRRLSGLRGTAVFLGRSDAGKSTLVKYLLRAMTAAGLPVGLVDADVGQSWLGLPGAVSSRVFHAPFTPREARWQALSFLGSVTPVPILSLLAAETARLALRSRQEAAVTLVDTTGLVDGELGRALKLAKLKAVAPELVVALAVGDELEPILSAVAEEITVRLAPSPLVKRRPPEVRSRHRHARLAAHFHGAREHLLAMRSFLFFHRGIPVHPAFAPPVAGTVIGLNRGKETRALGFVVEADADSLLVVTPLDSLRGVDRVLLGDFCFCPDGRGQISSAAPDAG
jgi:polynucleotide 5'-hydroxyl-kinase GRC3/NOL9